MDSKVKKAVSMKTKSFRYSPEEHPKVERWIQSLARNNIDFSKAIRSLIEGDQTEKNEIREEIASLKRQVKAFKDAGPGLEPAATQNIKESLTPRPSVYDLTRKRGTKGNEGRPDIPEEPAVNTGFIKSRYFS